MNTQRTARPRTRFLDYWMTKEALSPLSSLKNAIYPNITRCFYGAVKFCKMASAKADAMCG
jgi:hypothetical protein